MDAPAGGEKPPRSGSAGVILHLRAGGHSLPFDANDK
jgi:hypothetical protein